MIKSKTALQCVICIRKLKEAESHKLEINSSPIEVYLCTACLEKATTIPSVALKFNA